MQYRRRIRVNAAVNAAIVFTLLQVAADCFAANPFIGTWKFNDAKSEMQPGVSRNATITYSMQGDKIMVVTDGTNPDGKPKHSVWIGKFDGQSYPVKGNPVESYDAVAIRVIDDYNQLIQGIRDEKLVWWGTITISKDGKTRTALLRWFDANERENTVKKVYDKE